MRIPLDSINKEFNNLTKIKEVKAISEHYNIYKDLFDTGFFYPIVNLNVTFQDKINVWYGNKIDANQVSQFRKQLFSF